MKNLNVPITNDLKKRLDHLSTELGIYKKNIIAEALNDYIKKKKKLKNRLI